MTNVGYFVFDRPRSRAYENKHLFKKTSGVAKLYTEQQVEMNHIELVKRWVYDEIRKQR